MRAGPADPPRAFRRADSATTRAAHRRRRTCAPRGGGRRVRRRSRCSSAGERGIPDQRAPGHPRANDRPSHTPPRNDRPASPRAPAPRSTARSAAARPSLADGVSLLCGVDCLARIRKRLGQASIRPRSRVGLGELERAWRASARAAHAGEAASTCTGGRGRRGRAPRRSRRRPRRPGRAPAPARASAQKPLDVEAIQCTFARSV